MHKYSAQSLIARVGAEQVFKSDRGRASTGILRSASLIVRNDFMTASYMPSKVWQLSLRSLFVRCIRAKYEKKSAAKI